MSLPGGQVWAPALGLVCAQEWGRCPVRDLVPDAVANVGLSTPASRVSTAAFTSRTCLPELGRFLGFSVGEHPPACGGVLAGGRAAARWTCDLIPTHPQPSLCPKVLGVGISPLTGSLEQAFICLPPNFLKVSPHLRKYYMCAGESF